MKVSRSETKSALTSKHPKTASKKGESGLFGRLLGLGGVGGVTETEPAEYTEVNNLSTILSPESREELNKLITEIEMAGREFAAQPLYGNLIRYKLLIQQFMGIIVKSSYQVQQRIGKKSLTEEKIYSIVRRIDEGLEELSESVLNKQNNTMKLLNKLDEIRGLLIDLYK